MQGALEVVVVRVVTAFALVLASSSLAHAAPVDLSDMTDRDIVIETVSNACPPGDLQCEAEGVYASDPEATFSEIAGGASLTFDVPSNQATITVDRVDWAAQIAPLFGGCSVAGSNGLVCENVTDNIITIDLSNGQGVPLQTYWMGTLQIGFPLALITRNPDALDDWFFYSVPIPGQNVAVSCAEATPTNIPAGGCLAQDRRAPEAYDPITGTFTYLGVTDNGFLDPAYVLSRFRISEVPEPAIATLQLVSLLALALLAGRRRTT